MLPLPDSKKAARTLKIDKKRARMGGPIHGRGKEEEGVHRLRTFGSAQINKEEEISDNP